MILSRTNVDSEVSFLYTHRTRCYRFEPIVLAFVLSAWGTHTHKHTHLALHTHTEQTGSKRRAAESGDVVQERHRGLKWIERARLGRGGG